VEAIALAIAGGRVGFNAQSLCSLSVPVLFVDFEPGRSRAFSGPLRRPFGVPGWVSRAGNRASAAPAGIHNSVG
jgi:hypothetical protein